jgi:mRNA interferase MazF
MSAYPKRGEVYFVDLRGSQGSEQQGIRPALVVSTNLNNQFSSVITVIPITHTIPKRLFAQNVLIAAGLLDAVPNTAYCGQIQTIDKKRIKRFYAVLDSTVLEEVNWALQNYLDL